jgi:hypothetical protein
MTEKRPSSSPEQLNPVLAAWIEAGVIKLPSRPKEPIPKSPVRLPDGTSSELLEQDRADSHE